MIAHARPQPQPQSSQSLPSFADKALDLARRQREAHGGMAWKTVAIHFSDDQSAIISATYRVESLTSDGWHIVEYDTTRDTAVCDCVAGSWGKPCCHAGVAIIFGRSAAQAWGGQAEAERDAQRDDAHQGNTAALGY